MAWRVGVDSGGTFTDICLFDESSGRIAVWKVPSTPADPSHAVAQGVGEALAQIAARASDVSYFGHGTTVATNALIQHRGAPTGLVTSDGFPRPSRNRPAKKTRPLRSAGGQTARARRSQTSPRSAGTVAPRRAHRNCARRECGARRGLRFAGCWRQGSRSLLSVQLPRHNARGGGAAHRHGGIPRSLRLRLARGGARIPRIRAVVHDRGQRLSRADHGLSIFAASPTGWQRSASPRRRI